MESKIFTKRPGDFDNLYEDRECGQFGMTDCHHQKTMKHKLVNILSKCIRGYLHSEYEPNDTEYEQSYEERLSHYSAHIGSSEDTTMIVVSDQEQNWAKSATGMVEIEREN